MEKRKYAYSNLSNPKTIYNEDQGKPFLFLPAHF